MNVIPVEFSEKGIILKYAGVMCCSVGPAYISIRPAFESILNSIKTSPIGVIALYLPSTTDISFTNCVLHFGRFSTLDKKLKTLSFGTDTTQVSVTEFNIVGFCEIYFNVVFLINDAEIVDSNIKGKNTTRCHT
ncbi:MAG: hypothetical protein ACRDFB_04880 [Rhabdochlamydiaceae bacterium]